MKILISGGHLTPALALIDFVKSKHPQDSIVFVGRLFSQSQNKQAAREKQEIEKRGFKFINLDVPRFSLSKPTQLLRTLFLYPLSILKSLYILIANKPDVFVSFGGYLALPLSITSWFLRIPVVTHEQTVVSGSANRLISKIAKRVAISFPQSAEFFPAQKTILTGNLVRPEVLSTKKVKPNWFKATLNKPLVVVTGGNQGSYIINSTLSRSLSALTKRYIVVHACGGSLGQFNYQQELEKVKKKLTQAQQKNYYVRDWLDADEFAWSLTNANCLVSRSGANTVYELIISQAPAVLIPLPFAKNDEQTKNAKLVTDAGGAILLPQSKLTAPNLIKHIDQTVKYNNSMAKKLATLNVPRDGVKKFYQLLSEVTTKS